ncbi:MAG: thermonuclease family protein [Hyphomicrobiaceae bacterium]|nr:thermonuclease family protein [Hyphomicrobiaceae bacterium]
MRYVLSWFRSLGIVAFALSIGTTVFVASHSTVEAARPAPAPVEKFELFRGRARVIDGDTIDVGTTRVRLEGIDAPENGQTCHRRLIGSWPCGYAATTHLAKLIDGKDVECQNRGLDKYGRTLGICTFGTIDISAAMVSEGLAWAFVKYSKLYLPQEAEARSAKRGIWETDNMPAWDYRAKAWDVADDKAPDGCAIKGNVGRNGLIYHMPWSPWYGRIRMDGSGKRWFCSENEAVAAGWRAAYTR